MSNRLVYVIFDFQPNKWIFLCYKALGLRSVFSHESWRRIQLGEDSLHPRGYQNIFHFFPKQPTKNRIALAMLWGQAAKEGIKMKNYFMVSCAGDIWRNHVSGSGEDYGRLRSSSPRSLKKCIEQVYWSCLLVVAGGCTCWPGSILEWPDFEPFFWVWCLQFFLFPSKFPQKIWPVAMYLYAALQFLWKQS